ncbi:hypothetical protein [Corynebacterium ulceribovis]|uniref:hypothetical protein n=1 Tax=Corynebacterium ulceribovis TaxID=487732 RepID=UPI00058C9595|nr:hypothetical protein [Corynebacterium ulceribovis]
MHFRRPALRLTAVVSVAILTAACGIQDPALQAEFEESTEQSALPMPKATVEGDRTPEKTAPDVSEDPCATNDMVVAACLEETTALTPLGDERAVVGAGKELIMVARGAEPKPMAAFDSTVRQILPSPTVAADGQLWVLLHDGSVKRVTIFGQDRFDVRDYPEAYGVEVILLDANGEIVTLRNVSDNYFQLVSACQDPMTGLPILTGYEHGIPVVAAWGNRFIQPIGTVDAGEELGSCFVNGENLLVAGPAAGKVMHQKIAQNPQGTFELIGAPTTAVSGEFGRIQAAAVSMMGDEELFWISTSNKSLNATAEPSPSDDRVIIVPGGSASGASPD